MLHSKFYSRLMETEPLVCARSCIIMWLTCILGGDYCLENPANSLVALHPRYVWMVEKLLASGIRAACLVTRLYFIRKDFTSR